MDGRAIAVFGARARSERGGAAKAKAISRGNDAGKDDTADAIDLSGDEKD
jgi:hypothetical protein